MRHEGVFRFCHVAAVEFGREFQPTARIQPAKAGDSVKPGVKA